MSDQHDDKLELDDGDRALIDQLRRMPPEGDEPDWVKLEAQIRAEVGARRAPMPWWRNWRWIVPIWALATTAAIALIVLRDHREAPPTQHAVTIPHHEPVPTRTVTNAPAVWLDGDALNIDEIDDASLDALDQAAREALEPDEVSLEDLDDAALDRLEDWLDKERS